MAPKAFNYGTRIYTLAMVYGLWGLLYKIRKCWKGKTGGQEAILRAMEGGNNIPANYQADSGDILKTYPASPVVGDILHTSPATLPDPPVTSPASPVVGDILDTSPATLPDPTVTYPASPVVGDILDTSPATLPDPPVTSPASPVVGDVLDTFPATLPDSPGTYQEWGQQCPQISSLPRIQSFDDVSNLLAFFDGEGADFSQARPSHLSSHQAAMGSLGPRVISAGDSASTSAIQDPEVQQVEGPIARSEGGSGHE
ncbi:uncharacterized protein LOC110008060 [Amborella trichopoda]|uniref:Uncharacterized protein n=1 Tax=Amborella trichopoda TaxID=13333 RepID=U5CQ86_AMBTC|nr:uncharacterized protein LOC110008060 [Amborella trichopoda]ERN15341.1 hypothetical protein AMTR_s00036p00131280 [Amborella trichopoda]|eukprot:XP_020528872.1 uncharacterized protein LOC110008060 [Amborella trichopoda]